jgi:hypothetical protein
MRRRALAVGSSNMDALQAAMGVSQSSTQAIHLIQSQTHGWRTNPLIHGQAFEQPSDGLAVIHLHQDVISKQNKG